MEILRFTAAWCQPCKVLAKQLTEMNLDHMVSVVDIDLQPELAQKFGVRGVPTLVAIDEGIEVRRTVGVKSKDVLQEWFQKITDNKNIVKSIN